MVFEVVKSCGGPGISLKRGYIGPLNLEKSAIKDLLNAGYIKPVKEEKTTTKLKSKEIL